MAQINQNTAPRQEIFFMNKDTVVASILGFGLGLIAAIMLWLMPKILPKTPPSSPTSPLASIQASASSEPDKSEFKIDSPADGAIFTDESLTVKGEAPQASLVVAETQDQSQAVKTDKKDNFSTSLKLAEGGNYIVVTAYRNEKSDQKTLTVFYYPPGI